MNPIAGGKTKVTHINADANGAIDHETFAKGSPKDSSRGMDLSGDATNCISKPHLSRAESPTAKDASYTNKERF